MQIPHNVSDIRQWSSVLTEHCAKCLPPTLSAVRAYDAEKPACTQHGCVCANSLLSMGCVPLTTTVQAYEAHYDMVKTLSAQNCRQLSMHFVSIFFELMSKFIHKMDDKDCTLDDLVRHFECCRKAIKLFIHVWDCLPCQSLNRPETLTGILQKWVHRNLEKARLIDKAICLHRRRDKYDSVHNVLDITSLSCVMPMGRYTYEPYVVSWSEYRGKMTK